MPKFRLTRLLGVTVLLVAFMFALGAMPTLADGNGIVESVTGSSHMTIPLSVFVPGLEGNAEMRTLSYNALRHANGDVRGQYQYYLVVQGNPTTVHGTIICFKVEGNRAWIGATVDQTTDSSLVNQYSWWQVEDNGEGVQTPTDRTTFLGFGTLAETIDYCAGPAPNFIFEIEQGNIQVRDGS